MRHIVLLLFISLAIQNIIAQETDTIKDIRNNKVYTVVKIGDQWWMQENLNIGIRIEVGDNATDNDVIEKYCYDDDESMCDNYGGLYQWDEMMQYHPSGDTPVSTVQGVCPEGWHIPSQKEWDILAEHLGGSDFAGGKMKEAGTQHWEEPNTGATNESKFNGLPGGYRSYKDKFSYVGFYGNWWSSTDYTETGAWKQGLRFIDSKLNNYIYCKADGLSVRCVKD